MKIHVTHIHNAQAVEVDGSDWKVAFRNQRKFDYENATLNGVKMVEPSQEQREASKGNY